MEVTLNSDPKSSEGCRNSTEQLLTFCSIIYIGTAMICDPLALLSRTQADMIKAQLIRAGFSGCMCNTQLSEPCAAWTALILILSQASSDRSIHSTNLQCPDEIGAISDHVFKLRSQEILGDTEELLDRWAKLYSCQPDVALLVYLQKADVAGNNSALFVSKFGERFQRTFLENSDHNITEPVVVLSDKEPWFGKLFDKVQALSAMVGSEPTGGSVEDGLEEHGRVLSMPLWAVILLISCVVLVPITVLVERLFANSQGLRSKNKREIVHTGFLSDWRAGFAAGMLARNFNVTKERRRSDGRALASSVNTPRSSVQCALNL